MRIISASHPLGISLLFLLAVLVGEPAADRRQLIELIFGGNLPTRQPDFIEIGIADPGWSDLSNLSRIDRLTIEMDYGLKSVIYLLHPIVPNGQLFIYHEGHGADFSLHKGLMGRALERGFAVAGVAMPLAPINGGPRLTMTMPDGETWQIENHGALEYLRPALGHPIKYFIEPVVVFLNYADDLGYEHISMAGLSGGGWTTTLVAALDTRIDSSYPVAGSMPLGVRYWYDWGDWEQTEYDIYSIATYEDLYVLATNAGRRQLQILNRHDGCCFAADGRELVYYDEVRARSGERWDLWVDETSVGHDISPAAEVRIFGELGAFGVAEWYWLPVIVK